MLVFTRARVGGADQAAAFKAVIPFTLVVALLLISCIPALLLPVQRIGP